MIYRGQIEEKIYEVLSKTLHTMNYDIVRVRIQGNQTNKSIQIMIERLDGNNVTIEDCEAVSHQVIPSLFANGIDTSNDSVEISSPGLDRPLTRLKDFTNFIDYLVRVKTFRQVHGVTLFKGVLKDFNTESQIIEIDLQEPLKNSTSNLIKIEMSNINDAKLLIDHNKLFNKKLKKNINI